MDPMYGKNGPGSMRIMPLSPDCVLPCKAAGMIVWCQNKMLMIDRRVGSLGRACPAGHLDGDESAIACAARELFEETGLLIHPSHSRLLLHKNIFGNHCGRGAKDHEWSVSEADLGDVDFPPIELREPTKHCGIDWFKPNELENIEMEVVWRLILQRLQIIGR